MLESAGVEYFNPVVENWTPECQAEELKQREECDFCLYVITPKMTGVYSIAEVIDDSNKRPNKTILVLLEQDFPEEFTPVQWKSLKATSDMVSRNGAITSASLEDVVAFLKTA